MVPTKADTVLMELVRRGHDKAIQDLEFSIRHSTAGNLLDSAKDFGSGGDDGEAKLKATLEEVRKRREGK